MSHCLDWSRTVWIEGNSALLSWITTLQAAFLVAICLGDCIFLGSWFRFSIFGGGPVNFDFDFDSIHNYFDFPPGEDAWVKFLTATWSSHRNSTFIPTLYASCDTMCTRQWNACKETWVWTNSSKQIWGTEFTPGPKWMTGWICCKNVYWPKIDFKVLANDFN